MCFRIWKNKTKQHKAKYTKILRFYVGFGQHISRFLKKLLLQNCLFFKWKSLWVDTQKKVLESFLLLCDAWKECRTVPHPICCCAQLVRRLLHNFSYLQQRPNGIIFSTVGTRKLPLHFLSILLLVYVNIKKIFQQFDCNNQLQQGLFIFCFK